jgi:hypothetical protein
MHAIKQLLPPPCSSEMYVRHAASMSQIVLTFTLRNALIPGRMSYHLAAAAKVRSCTCTQTLHANFTAARHDGNFHICKLNAIGQV